jgi:DNA polymerase-1
MDAPRPPETLYLIDGYASIFRAFFAIRRPLYSPVTGEPTQGVLVFAQMLLKLYTKFTPDYVAVALDAPGRTFRDDLYEQYEQHRAAAPLPTTDVPESVTRPTVTPAPPVVARYKGTRPATPDPLGQQIPRILELLELFGVPVVQKPGLEADDVIATLTERVLQDPALPDLRVRIVTRDKDMEQLLDEQGRVTIFDIHEETELDAAALRQKRGVSPAQVVDLLALTGDVVDNIPGVDGIGPKTAAKLLQQFGSVDGVLENLGEIKGWWRDNLEQARPTLPISREMVTLKHDPSIPFRLESARVRRPLPAPELLRFFEELGFSRLKDKLEELSSQ